MEQLHGTTTPERHDMEYTRITCPICGRKTKNRIRADTEAKRFPLWCPVCKYESVVDIAQGKIKLSKEIKNEINRYSRNDEQC